MCFLMWPGEIKDIAHFTSITEQGRNDTTASVKSLTACLHQIDYEEPCSME